MNRYSSFQSRQSKCINISHVAGICRESFSEHEILTVNDLLLSNGFHTITVKNLSVGRTIIDTFLTLLNRYQQVYWLSNDTNDTAVPNLVYDLYACMKKAGCLKAGSVEAYETYFYEEFYGDFLIIEGTDHLMSESWYANFEQALYEIHMFDQIPVVQLMYGQYQ